MYKFQDLNNQMDSNNNNISNMTTQSQDVIDAAVQGLGVSRPTMCMSRLAGVHAHLNKVSHAHLNKVLFYSIVMGRLVNLLNAFYSKRT